MIDIHAHLCFPQFDGDRDRIVAECEKEMSAVVVSSARYEEGLCALRLASEHKKLYVTLGYHPTEGGNNPERIIELVKASSGSIAGVGEVGMDFHWEKDAEKRKEQGRIFEEFIGLADRLGKPLVIHSWDAERECFEMVRGFGQDVIFHCFSGPPELATEIIKCGFYISFSTQVLFSKHHRKLARIVPLEMMMLETDSPFLSPLNYLKSKGEDPRLKSGFDPGRNYPWNIRFSAGKIAEIKQVTPGEVLRTTAGNSARVFGLDYEK